MTSSHTILAAIAANEPAETNGVNHTRGGLEVAQDDADRAAWLNSFMAGWRKEARSKRAKMARLGRSSRRKARELA